MKLQKAKIISDLHFKNNDIIFGYIYKTTNLQNGKIYIGKKKGLVEKTQNYLGSGKYFCRALQKYGRENFEKEILEVCHDKDILNFREKFWIKYFDSKIPQGYNISKGGDWGDVLSNHPNIKEIGRKISKALKNHPSLKALKSEETKQKMSKSHKGKKLTNEHKLNIGKAGLGRKYSEESKQKISIIRKKLFKDGILDLSGKNNPNYGKHLSKEVRENISKKAKERMSNPENNPWFGRSLYQIWMDKYDKEEADRRYSCWKIKIGEASKRSWDKKNKNE